MDAAIFGNIVADVIGRPMDLARPPAPGSMSLLDSLTLTTGGCVCNVALAMAKLGMSVAGAGLVGDDSLGETLDQRLSSGGVDTSCIRRDGRAQTSATIVAVAADGERSFFHTSSVTRLVDAAAFRACFDLFRRCQWVHIGYFGLLPGLVDDLPELLAELSTFCPNTRISLDTANPPADRAALDRILPHLDVFAPSRPEALELTGERKPAKMVQSFRECMPKGLIGIKLDADGCHLDDGTASVNVPAYKVDVIDTTGAGDTWFAGLLTGLRRNLPLEQCGRLANRAAADSCTMLGASAGVRSYEDTVARL